MLQLYNQLIEKGESINEAKKITDYDLIESLGCIPENKKHCSLLGVKRLQSVIKEYKFKGIRKNKKTGELIKEDL